MENEITQEQFNAYENVRLTGLTNMLDIQAVSEYSGLDRMVVLDIITNYTKLKEKFQKEGKK